MLSGVSFAMVKIGAQPLGDHGLFRHVNFSTY